MSNVEYGTMELLTKRSQQKRCAKIVMVVLIVVIIIIVISLVLKNLGADEDEVKTCEPTISVRKMGQFANQIWEYMSLYTIWQTKQAELKKYNIVPYIEEDMKENLEDLFENLTIPSFPKIYTMCSDRDTFIVRKDRPFQASNIASRRNFLLDSYSARYEDVIAYRLDNIKKELRFKQSYVDDIMRKLDEIRMEKGLANNDTTFVGMHYRGGDYIPHLQGNHGDKFKGPPNYSYYIAAMNHFKAKYNNTIFILISIDQTWLSANQEKILEHGTVVLNPFKNDRNRDFTLLSYCNHTIINYGTFGVTAALFSEGETVFYDLELPIDHRGETIAIGISQICHNWIGMKNANEKDLSKVDE